MLKQNYIMLKQNYIKKWHKLNQQYTKYFNNIILTKSHQIKINHDSNNLNILDKIFYLIGNYL